MGVSSGAGAMAAGAAATEVGMARQIGLDLGMAFQIKDDILDYAPSEQTGKSSCADLREGKVTLPLIAIFERCGDEERARIMEKVKLPAKIPGLSKKSRRSSAAKGVSRPPRVSWRSTSGGLAASLSPIPIPFTAVRSNCSATTSATGSGNRWIPFFGGAVFVLNP